MGSAVEHPRSALVTRAAEGIGRAIAEGCPADGPAVTIADLPSSTPLLVELAAALGAFEQVLSVAVDVSILLRSRTRCGFTWTGSAGSTSWSRTPASPQCRLRHGSLVVDGGTWYS
jgi:NAD(P)-dependent dehydrogenase (short-subunit alcohol dehydrogenase family)